MPAGLHATRDADERDQRSLGLALGKFRPGGRSTPDDLVLSATSDHEAEVYFAGTDAVFELNHRYALPEGTSPHGVDVGRINPDTKNDFVVAIGRDAPCSPGGGIAVFLGYGDGTFREPPYLFCVDPGNSPKPRFVKIADMDQDTFNDVVTSNYGTHNISVLINGVDAIPWGGG